MNKIFWHVSRLTDRRIRGRNIQLYRVEVAMNHHYIDYMIKQQQQMEREDCERRRMLKAAGFGNSGVIHRVVKKLNRALGKLSAHLELGKQAHLFPLSVVDLVKQRKGEEI